MTTLSSVVLLGIAAVILLQLATRGIIEAKQTTAIHEALGSKVFMEQSIRGPELRGLATSEAMNRLADQIVAQTGQYKMLMKAPTANFVSRGLDRKSVPPALEQAVSHSDGVFIASTQIRWTDPYQQPEPGLAVGLRILAPRGETIEVYFVFPMTAEQHVLSSIESAVVITFVLLALALAIAVYWVSWWVVAPVRRASDTALRLASGDLGERMAVRGSDEVVSLAESMNQMAEELQSRIRQLESLSAVQRQFVSDVSHELRTPLTTIKMASDLLYEQRTTMPRTAVRTVELMWSEIERFDLLLADLLEISRFDAGVASLLLEDCDLALLVKEEILACEALARQQGSVIHLEVRDQDTTAEIDPRRIRRVLRNLLSNAIDHGQGKPIDVVVAADKETVAVTVRDRGVGLEPDQTTKVFQRFWRADPSRTRVVGGSGLGLSIAMEDTKLHRGWLSVWGKPGHGAQFRLTLPRSESKHVVTSPLPVVPSEEGGEE